jgi:adenylate kinase family enzyme
MREDWSLNEAKRILVYGVCGSGKTTLAEKIGERTGLPWHSVDDLAWEPNWVPATDEKQIAVVSGIVDEPEWVLDTAYGKWLELPLSRVELIVGLDYPRWFSLMRLLRRTLMRVIDGRPICNGNRETVRQMLSRDSIIVWHFKSFARKRRRMREWAASEDGPRVVLLKSSREADEWLSTLSAVRSM